MDKEFDADARQQELIERFASMDPKEAQRQIAILPYYHQLENEIIKPNQGLYISRYFLTKWRPNLGQEASNIVLALRLLANKEGETFASLETISKYAAMSPRCLRRWISENENAVKDRSETWKNQWRLLNTYFIRSKSPRYLIRKEGNLSRARRTTNLYQVAMDDPVHPDDEGILHVKAAERIVADEATKLINALKNSGESYKGPVGLHKKKVVIFEDQNVDNSPYKGPVGLFKDRPSGPGLSLSYRNETNVNVTKKSPSNEKTSKANEVDFLVMDIMEICQDSHSKGFYRLIAQKCPREMIYVALSEVKDLKLTHRLKKTAGAAFTSIIRASAKDAGIDLGLKKD